jgi:hypothetical protein
LASTVIFHQSALIYADFFPRRLARISELRAICFKLMLDYELPSKNPALSATLVRV